MKNIFYKITLLVFLTGSISSCEDKLDQIPFDSYGTSNAYITAADYENAIRGVYHELASGSLYGGSDSGGMLDAPDVLSDNVILAQKGRGSRRNLHNWQYTASDSPMNGLYRNAYQLIYRANVILANIEGFNGPNREKIIAEAKALRALAHLNVATFFAKIPTQSGDANGSLGVAYVTTDDPNIDPARETVAKTYEMIVQDLLDARNGIPVESVPGRLNKDAVNVLLSRVYLYMGQWQNSINAANDVTAPIAPRTSIVGVWEDSNTDGVLFYIPNEQAVLGLSPGVTWSQFSQTSLVPEYVVAYEFYNMFADDDIRKDAYTMQANNANLHFNAIKKLFARAGGGEPGKVDLKIFRAAEASINKAEALYNLGQEGPARTALDAVRTKRYLNPPSGETGNALRDAIRLERRLEFAFESQRFFDIKRWGLSVERDGFGDLADGSGVPSASQNLSNGNDKFQLPISQTAIDLNPNIVQNPGY
ncbi:MAG: RagB/SusD family nutrient uptake outer membrane protein [Aequorivita sp.]|nr:RagB/SusD family nutrient uptake outer membrane protein [Aequorivita sp.]